MDFEWIRNNTNTHLICFFFLALFSKKEHIKSKSELFEHREIVQFLLYRLSACHDEIVKHKT